MMDKTDARISKLRLQIRRRQRKRRDEFESIQELLMLLEAGTFDCKVTRLASRAMRWRLADAKLLIRVAQVSSLIGYELHPKHKVDEPRSKIFAINDGYQYLKSIGCTPTRYWEDWIKCFPARAPAIIPRIANNCFASVSVGFVADQGYRIIHPTNDPVVSSPPSLTLTPPKIDDGLNELERTFVWGGRYYFDLKAPMMKVLAILEAAHPSGRHVHIEEMREKTGDDFSEGFFKVFDMRIDGKNRPHDVRWLIDGPKGSYRLIDPAKIKIPE